MNKLMTSLTISLLILTFTLVAYGSPVFSSQTECPVEVKAALAVYNGNECFVIRIKEGEIPVNAPEKVLQLISGEKNGYKVFRLHQIAPGKYVTVSDSPIVLEGESFKLRFQGSSRITNDIEIISECPIDPGKQVK